jgi:hypothetical protein
MMRAPSSSDPRSTVGSPPWLRRAALAACFALLASSSCSGGGGEAKVEAIAYGEATCARCGAVIRDAAFAAQSRFSGGRVKLFDDPGCLLLSLGEEAEAPRHVFFRHHAADRWIAGADAWFVKTPKTESPQKHGWAAFASFAEAQDEVTGGGGGEILPYEQLRQRLAE